MTFNSPIFIFIFLPIFYCFYFITPGILRKNFIAVLFSVAFYSWGEPVFIIYVVVGTAIDYFIVRYFITNPRVSPMVCKIMLAIAIGVSVLSLIYFKYFNFLADQFLPISKLFLGWSGSFNHVMLPLGVSFITFHKISFVIDLYKNRAAPPRNFLDVLLYILFFPQLVAGPIIRYHDIRDQITSRNHSTDDFLKGFLRFAIGFAKKVLLADPVGRMADTVFSAPPDTMPVHYLWLGTLAYAIQIYFDFSGYSDMAIGLGRTVGFRFPENFNRPYISKSITEFWQRWHISLSNWMRLYLYIPLGGNRVSPRRMYFNLWIVFLISGFWHGAAWTFIAWGAYYGFFLVLEKAYERRAWSFVMPKPVAQILTLLVIMTGWVLFRASSLDYAGHFIGRMYGLLPAADVIPEPFGLVFGARGVEVLGIGIALAMLPIPASWVSRSEKSLGLFKAAIYLIAASTILATGASAVAASGYSPFLYFRF